MKKLLLPCVLLLLLDLLSANLSNIQAQDVKEQLAQIDTTAFKGRVFLNKAIVIKELIDPVSVTSLNLRKYIFHN